MTNQSTPLCIDPVTRDEVKEFSLALGVPGIASLALSLVGLAAELLFVCRHKNTFLLRLFIYLSVVVSLTVSMYAFLILIYADQTRLYYQLVCEIGFGFLHYIIFVEIFFIYSIDGLLLQKVLLSVCNQSSKVQKFIRYTNTLSQRQWKILEILFLVANTTLPLIFTVVNLVVIQDPAIWIPRDVCAAQFLESDCFTWTNSTALFYQFIFSYIIPGSCTVALSIVCVLTLVLWLAWLQRRKMLRGKVKLLIKEMTLLLTYLISFCISWVLILILQQTIHSHQPAVILNYVLYPIKHLTPSISFFVYLCVSYRHRRQATQLTSADKFRDGLTAQPTVPPSTRVSLPSDTDALAQKFLTPIEEEPSEYTPLIVNYP